MTNYIHIGKIVAPFGVKGEMILTHKLGNKTALKGIEVVFIEEVKGSYLPYFISASKKKSEEEIYLQVEGVATKEATRRLMQKNVWLPEEDFNKIVDKAAPIGLIGFVVFNEDEKIGSVEEVIEQPHQVLLRIDYKGKEALIPIHAETLDKIDRTKKEVHVTLPDGLLELYA